MALQQITAADIVGWDSLQDIAFSSEKWWLKLRPNFAGDNELILQLTDEFIVLVKASLGESTVDFKPKDTDHRQTNLVAIIDFKEFTTTTRVLTFGQ